MVPHRMPNGLLHARFHAIGNQHHVKDLTLASLVHFFQAAGGPYAITSAFQPLEPQPQGRFGSHDQEQRSRESMLCHSGVTSMQQTLLRLL